MTTHFITSRTAAVAGLIAAFAIISGSAGAQPSHEALIAKCKASMTEFMRSCMGRDMSKRQGCIAKATPAVRACYLRESTKYVKAAPAAPKEDTAAAKDAAPVATTFVAPPRTIADITAILDKEKPDEAKIAERKEEADAQPPKAASRSDLAQFHFDRGGQRLLLNRNKEALDDFLKAREYAAGDRRVLGIARQWLGVAYLANGNPKDAIATWQTNVREALGPGSPVTRGSLIAASRGIAQAMLAIGDISQADANARQVISRVQEARSSPHPNWRANYPIYGANWESEADAMRAMVFEARGQYRDAEAAYRRAEAFKRAAIKNIDKMDAAAPEEQFVRAADEFRLSVARVEAKQSRLNEAEADARRALLSALKTNGKYHPYTPTFIVGLAGVLIEQGRYEEAEKLTRAADEVQRKLGFPDDSLASVKVRAQLGDVLTLQRKTREAAEVYAALEKSVEKWEPQRRDAYLLNAGRIAALYASGQVEAGIAAAQELVKRQVARLGESHFDAAAARGTLAIGYFKAQRNADAAREFKAALPIMLAASRDGKDDDDPTLVAARSQRLQVVVEGYIGLLARGGNRSADTAAETFALADAIRGHSVQQALAASSARMIAKDPALQELVRQEQDLGKQIGGQLGTLNNVLSLPSSERDDKGVATINASIVKLRADRQKAREEINRRFPSYADLVDPKPPTVEQIKATLRPGEALLSFYFGQEGSFVWAVPKDGAIDFAAVPDTALTLEAKVRKLREALEPQASTIGDIPPFDLALGYELYSGLLKQVEPGWKSANNLIVVTNGALGLLPLSLLPTAPSEARDGDAYFSGYKSVPWLARTHAVTMVPSVAALRTLRALPPGKPSRDKLIAFGDPLFSKEQAADADKPVQVADASAVTTRGLPLKRRSAPQLEGVDSAELAQLPRLPDTADELKAIATALEADPTKVLNLGKEANEKKVKAIDLSGFRILAFATHGLVPGELNGLRQPALALSAPDVAGAEGDGLLTMEEILALKLDADWVVLSACNTGTGAGAGAEAASGLGRAFFYAGTRALLVTNWSVHSASARELVSDLFRRQAQDGKITRGEALQQAMLALIDGDGFKGSDGKTLFAYAHPLFWAPYSIIGDGGTN